MTTGDKLQDGRRISRWLTAALALPLIAACASPDSGSATSGPVPAGAPEPLAKVDGWRDGLVEDLGDEQPYALVEIAFDQATAERVWQENVPEDLADRTGTPDEEGRYGELDGVDFDTQALVVWSSGESGSCPAWLDDISTDGEGVVELTTDQTGSVCTDDFHPYRMVLVVHRDRLPDPTWLPTEEVKLDGRALDWGGLVRDYPAE